MSATTLPSREFAGARKCATKIGTRRCQLAADEQDYVVRLDKLKEAYGHNIEVLQEGAETMERFNCFSYAFGAWNEERFNALVIKRAQEKLAPLNSGFVKTLIDDGFIADVSDGSPAVGDVALYLKDGVLTHAGHVVDASSTEPIIQSKWGGNEVHRHPLWEVPFSYGHEVRFVRAPPWMSFLIA